MKFLRILVSPSLFGRTSILSVILLLGAGLPLAHADDPPRASSAIDPLYQEVASGMYFDKVPPNTGPALTIDLGKAGRLTLPPRFAEQEVFEVKRLFYLGPGLEDAVAVGLHARSSDGIPQGFVLVYALQNRKGVLKAELPLREHFLGFEEGMIDQQPVLAILGASGAHFHDLWVYRFRDGKPELLLAQGSAAGVDLRTDPTTGDPQVWVGVENWAEPSWNYATGKRLWNVYTWTGKEFTLNPALSTARETTAGERAEWYVAQVKEGMKKLKGTKKRPQ